MTNRAEIERLLQMTSRTLEGLPTETEYLDLKNYGARCEELERCLSEGGFELTYPCMLHQFDVIELLVGALRDALDKPRQKPLTLEEVKNAGVVFVEYQYTKDLRTAFVVKSANNRDFNVIAAKGTSTLRDCTLTQMINPLFGKTWRAWPSRPTDEERSAAAWES